MGRMGALGDGLAKSRLPTNARVNGPQPSGGRQLLLEDFPGSLLRTETSLDPGSKDQEIVSPSSRPRTATIGSGTVVRREADRSIAFTSLDSYSFATGSADANAPLPYVAVGQRVGRRVGSNIKYSHAVGILVGQHMTELPPTLPSREVRALEMLQTRKRVAETSTPGEYVVASQSGDGLYRVRTDAPFGPAESCDCSDFIERRAPCKHIYLVRHWLADNGKVDEALTGGFKIPAPPRVKRDWSVYNESQAEEYRLFNTLLRDLSIGFPEPFKDPHLAGRKPIPLREQVFCATQKAYLGFSLRRSHGFRTEAARNGLLSRAPYWTVPSRFACREDVTQGLHDMLARSAIPLIGLEDRCAIDSTGLRTTRFNNYRKEKYDPSRENIWLKLHALVGVKTHVIPVLEVTAGAANDSPQFPVLLERATANGFHFKEVYADKGYQGRENFNAAANLEILPFIPFKSNQTGQSKGSPMYHKMFLFFQYHREEFDQHYGQRAQVESTFGSFKQKFGETLASKKFLSQVNEVLCTAIAHNITILVRQMFEVGILPDFLKPPAETGLTVSHRQDTPTNLLLLNRPQLEAAVTLSSPRQ